MGNIAQRLIQAVKRKTVTGHAYPQGQTFYEYPAVPLADVVKLYEKDPTVKASVDLVAGAVCGQGFYTTADPKFKRYEQAKDVVDSFNAEVNLDQLLLDGVRMLVASGNDFWLKITPGKLENLLRLPLESVQSIDRQYITTDSLKIPYAVTGYTLNASYGGKQLRPEAVVHFKINPLEGSAFGTGVVQVLLHRLALYGEVRPSLSETKAKLEKLFPKILEKYAGPDVLALLEKASEEDVKKLEAAIRNRPSEGAWLFYTGKGDIKPVQIDPRARFEYYVDYVINQFYLGLETPLPRLFSTPGFTEASATVAKEMLEWIINPLKRYVKRLVEREVFTPVLLQAGFDPAKANVRLNWGLPETPKPQVADLLKAAELGLIRPEEFRKNMVKFGWELWQEPQQAEGTESLKREAEKVKAKWLLQRLE